MCETDGFGKRLLTSARLRNSRDSAGKSVFVLYATLALEQRKGGQEMGRALQHELKRAGCFEGVIDGEFNAATREASQRLSFPLMADKLETRWNRSLGTKRGFADNLQHPVVVGAVGAEPATLTMNHDQPNGH